MHELASARVALFHPALACGGIQQLFLNLAKGFRGRGIEVHLVQATPGDELRAQVPSGIRVIDFNASRVLNSLPALIGYLRRERPTAMICGAVQANAIALWARRLAGGNTRMIITEHNNLQAVTQNAPNLRARMTPQVVRWFYPWADEIIAVSQGVAQSVAYTAHIPLTRVHVIFNPVDFAEIRNKATESVEHPWFRPGEPPVIVAAGRLTAAKDYPTLIRAMQTMSTRRRARLVILGDGEERHALESLVKELQLLSVISLPGFSRNPYAYMARSAVFVMSSAWEGLPTILIEALALNCRIVSTDCGNGARYILGEGKYAKLVPVGDPNRLAEAVLIAIDEPRPRISAEILQPFAMDFAVDSYLELILGSKRKKDGTSMPCSKTASCGKRR